MRLLSVISLFLLVLTGYAQPKKQSTPPLLKKPLTHDVYDQWKEIPYRSIANDGGFAAFTINPQDGDGKVIFYNLKTSSQDSVRRAADINLTWDSQHAIFKIKPQQKLVKDLRRQKKKKEDLPKDSLGIYSITTRKTEKIPDVKSYSIPAKAGGWVAFQLEAKKEEKPKTS